MAKKPAPKIDAPFAAPDWPASRVEMRRLDKIIPYEKNPRTHPAEQITALAKDMRDDGVTMPILVDENSVIICGHGRALAAAANKFEEYPVVVARGWSEEQKRAARIKDNARGLQSGWDAELIRFEVGNLKLGGYDIQLLGFPESQLRGWGISMGIESGIDPDEVPERPKKPIVRRGDRWILGDHVLVCGDSTSKPDVATCIGKLHPSLMVSDPPYGVDYDPDWRNRADRANGKPYGARAIGQVKNDGQSDWTEAWK